MRTFVHVLIVMALAGCAGRSAIESDVCEIASNQEFLGKMVRLEGSVRAATHSRIVLYDDSCSKTIGISIPSAMDGDARVEQLRQVALQGYPQTIGQHKAEVTIEGIVYIAQSGAPIRSLELTRIVRFDRGG